MNLGIIILIAVAGIWFLGVFFGAIGELSKTFSNNPTASIDSSETKAQEQKIVDDTAAKEQMMMDDMKQKRQDMGQKF